MKPNPPPREIYIEFHGDPIKDNEFYQRYCGVEKFDPVGFDAEVIRFIDYESYEALLKITQDQEEKYVKLSKKIESLQKDYDDCITDRARIFHKGNEYKSELEALREENAKYRQEMDKMTNGIPSEFAYAILKKERDQLREENKKQQEENVFLKDQMNIASEEQTYANRMLELFHTRRESDQRVIELRSCLDRYKAMCDRMALSLNQFSKMSAIHDFADKTVCLQVMSAVIAESAYLYKEYESGVKDERE